MAQYSAEAIVLAVHNWGDADKMVTFMTRDQGKIKAAAYGSRRPKSPLAAGMQMFNHIEVQLLEGQRLATVKQYALKNSFRFISEDLTAMAYASFIAELTLELCPEHQPQQDIFAKILQFFAAFEQRNPRLVALAAAFQLLEYTGSQLSFASCALCGTQDEAALTFFSWEQGGVICEKCHQPGMEELPENLRAFILFLLNFDWVKPQPFKITGAAMVRAERLLLGYLQYLLEKPLRSLAFIQQIAEMKLPKRAN